MKFNDILKEAQIGKAAFDTSISSDEILENYDNDYKIFYASKRMSALVEGVTTDSIALQLIDNIIKISADVENRGTKTIPPSPTYYKMKLVPITESYNALIKRFDDKKYYTKIDKQKFAKILATASYMIEHIADEAGKESMTKDIPVILEDTFISESDLISSIVG